MENFANSTPMQVTLRQMHAYLVNPRFWIGFVAVVALLTIMGPFGTLQDMEFAPRLVYWGAISLITFPLGSGISTYFSVVFQRAGLPMMLARLLAGAIAGFPLTGVVWAINLPTIESGRSAPAYLLQLAVYVIPVTIAISLIYYLVTSTANHEARQHAGPDRSNAAVAPTPPPAARADIRFLQRLPVELGKDIISLQAQDHYVQVATTRGNELVLVRLEDAIGELEGVPGLRVHRSWWVATDAVEAVRKSEGKLILVLKGQREVPVSRSYQKDVRAAFPAL